ncbi:phosphoglycolate phosphatase [Desulfovibrionaceae bacterium]|nr:phosphoglycolate phosphatase [Desulfovibrionaceae bacterium]GKI11046.1 phosphoglycolate phosphatase [Desulfovibrionaceae bacterium]
MTYTDIFFDLDGTLTDSKPGIIRSVEHALDFFHIHVPPEQLIPFIGPPLHDSFAPFFDNDTARVDLAIQKYREYYSVKGIFENSLYDGITDLLRGLQALGRRLCVATSKPEPFARRVLEHFRIDGFFSFVAGAELHGPRNNKTEVLRYACTQLGIEDMSPCLMVGDRKYDVRGAHNVGMACAGVLYGYGPREELTEARAEYLCASVDDLEKLLLADAPGA